MNAEVFWQVIENYNQQTYIIQIVLLIAIITAIILSYCRVANWTVKFALGITNLFIGITHFAILGKMPIQFFFAAPLYISVGLLFCYECIKNPKDTLHKPNIIQMLLLTLYLFYPLVSFLLGNKFPHMVTYIMPCPIISLSIAVYSCYGKRNLPLLILMTIWGLTGVKAFIANAYEDIILLICGVYGVVIVVKEIYGRIKANKERKSL